MLHLTASGENSLERIVEAVSNYAARGGNVLLVYADHGGELQVIVL